MERRNKGQKIGKILNTISNFDSIELNSRTTYNNYHNKTIIKTERNRDDLDERYSQNSNSVHTSYKYRKRKKGNMTISSRESNDYYIQNLENESSVSMSINDNLICPDCINEALIDQKRIRNDLNNRNNDLQDRYKYQTINNSFYENDLIEKKIHQREINTNNAMKTLSKLNSSMSNKERLIKINENSADPFHENNRDYQYEKFRKEYEKKQKFINDNLDKYLTVKKKKSLSETPLFFDKSDEKINSNTNRNRNESTNKKEYIKILEEQIKYKREKNKKEKEEDKIREKRYYEEIEEKIKKEENDKKIKEQNLKDDFIKGNRDIINKKNQDKIKEFNENLKYKEFLDKKNEQYKKELLEKQKENERLLNEINNSTKKINDSYNKKNMKYKRIESNEENEENNSNFNNNNDNKNIQNKNEKKYCCYDLNKQKGECCRCHRVLPRRLLTINRYFYRDNRKFY
jgi:hypothetical protein